MPQLSCRELQLTVNEDELRIVSEYLAVELERWREKFSISQEITLQKILDMSSLENSDLNWAFNCHRLGYSNFNYDNVNEGVEEKWADFRSRWSKYLHNVADQYLGGI